ncbi:MAG: L-aspartate oxidase [Ruminococcaceae bacterium]|nr:L-aspartate oxidase [Oscillospiraceae bacterium]
MRRYIYSKELNNPDTLDFDVLIVGSGLAGLYAALHIDPTKSVALVTKVNIESSNSFLAQGGIAAVIDPSDNFESHVEDTLKAGAGMCDPTAVDVLVKEGPENIKELVEMNVPFDTNPEGELMITREGGHSCRRIVHCGGDATGRETTKTLGQIAMNRENVTTLFETYMIDIVTQNGKAVGGIFRDTKNNRDFIIRSSNIIISTGGIGAIYNHTTNPCDAIGDGIAAAMRAGAEVVNMEMVQFHPTTLIPHSNSDRLFLISEAVRGEGGILKNHEKKAFMQGKHELADLAPRDIVTRAILAELKRSGKSHVFLDVSSMTKEFFSKRFPTIYNECTEFGINLPDDMIPVRPAQHYLMGGIRTNLWGMTNIEGLYACGECAWTGIHGANRLASNSMLECLVFSRRAARHINEKTLPEVSFKLPETKISADERLTSKYISGTKGKIRDIMTEYAGPIRTEKGLAEAAGKIYRIYKKLQDTPLVENEEYELYNMTQNAYKIVTDALSRKESIGAHYIVHEDEK